MDRPTTSLCFLREWKEGDFRAEVVSQPEGPVASSNPPNLLCGSHIVFLLLMGEGVWPVHCQVFLWHTGFCAVTQGQQGWQSARPLEHPNHFVCQSTRKKK